MNQKTKAAYKARAEIIKAMSHPARLFIIEELNKNEKCVNELRDMIQSDMSTVSKHLKILKNAGLVYDEKRGTTIYYKLKVPCITEFFGCIEAVLESNVKQQMNILKCCKKIS